MATLTWKETRFLQVPLTPEEVLQRGEQLASTIKEREALLAQHKTEKDVMKFNLERCEARIHNLSVVVNERVEERTVAVELRCDLGLGLIEEIRLDTGELVLQRSATEKDKLRAQAEAQQEIPGTPPPQTP